MFVNKLDLVKQQQVYKESTLGCLIQGGVLIIEGVGKV